MLCPSFFLPLFLKASISSTSHNTPQPKRLPLDSFLLQPRVFWARTAPRNRGWSSSSCGFASVSTSCILFLQAGLLPSQFGLWIWRLSSFWLISPSLKIHPPRTAPLRREGPRHTWWRPKAHLVRSLQLHQANHKQYLMFHNIWRKRELEWPQKSRYFWKMHCLSVQSIPIPHQKEEETIQDTDQCTHCLDNCLLQNFHFKPFPSSSSSWNSKPENKIFIFKIYYIFIHPWRKEITANKIEMHLCILAASIIHTPASPNSKVLSC